MNTTLRTTLILSAILIIVALVALPTLKSWADPEVSIPAYSGRGDYQHFESQFYQPTTGRGDYLSTLRIAVLPTLHRKGWLSTLRIAVHSTGYRSTGSNLSYVRMGNLRYFDAMQEIEYAGEIPPSPLWV
jgi:hypothetical protein